MTRQEVEDQVARTLGRSDLGPDIAFWFKIAHKDAQQRYNKFPATEVTLLTPLVAGTNRYAVPDNFREPIVAYLWKPSRSAVINFYNKYNIETIRMTRFESDPLVDPTAIIDEVDEMKYAIHANFFELWPDVDASFIDGENQFGVDYYAWLTVPDASASDWFTDHAFDFLLYRVLIEAVSHLGLSSELGKDWAAKADASVPGFVNQQISKQMSGKLRIRG